MEELRKYALFSEAAAGSVRAVGSLARKHPMGTVAGVVGTGAVLPDTAKAVKNTFNDKLQRSIVARAGVPQ